MSTASESTASKTPSSETASLQTLTEQQFLQHKAFYNKGYTRSLDFRLGQLTALKKAIQRYESEIFQALKQDLGKSNFEAYATEVGFVLELGRGRRPGGGAGLSACPAQRSEHP